MNFINSHVLNWQRLRYHRHNIHIERETVVTKGILLPFIDKLKQKKYPNNVDYWTFKTFIISQYFCFESHSLP